MMITATKPSRLRRLRTDKGIRMVQLAKAIGLSSVAVISEAERGLYIPSESLAGKWGDALGVSGEYVRRLAREAGKSS